MQKTLWFGVVMCVCLVGSGCSSPADRYKAEIKKSILALNDAFWVLYENRDGQTKVVPGSNAKLPFSGTQMDDLADQLTTLRAKIDEAEPKDEKIKEKILLQYTPAYDVVLMNLNNLRGMLKTPDSAGATTLKKLGDAIKSYESLLRDDDGKPLHPTK